MDRETIIAILRRDEAELRALGVERLSLFGSVARGDNFRHSDVDVAVTLDRNRMLAGFAYATRLEELREKLEAVLEFVTFENLPQKQLCRDAHLDSGGYRAWLEGLWD